MSRFQASEFAIGPVRRKHQPPIASTSEQSGMSSAALLLVGTAGPAGTRLKVTDRPADPVRVSSGGSTE